MKPREGPDALTSEGQAACRKLLQDSVATPWVYVSAGRYAPTAARIVAASGNTWDDIIKVVTLTADSAEGRLIVAAVNNFERLLDEVASLRGRLAGTRE